MLSAEFNREQPPQDRNTRGNAGQKPHINNLNTYQEDVGRTPQIAVLSLSAAVLTFSALTLTLPETLSADEAMLC